MTCPSCGGELVYGEQSETGWVHKDIVQALQDGCDRIEVQPESKQVREGVSG